MSAPEQALRQPEGVTEEQTPATERLGIDPRYTVVPEVDASGHLGKVVDPFVDMVYPLNEDSDIPRGVVRNSGRWQAKHRPDGSGVVESSAGTATYGIRTAGGTIVGDVREDFWFPWASDYHQRRPDDSGEVEVYDYDWFIEIPFRFVGEVLTMQTDLDLADEDSALRIGRDEETFVEGPDFMREVVAADILDDDTERGVLLTHDSGVQVYIGYDSTAYGDSEVFGFVPFDGEKGVPAPSASDALDLLRPNRAAAAEESNVERQGEWFLVPTAEEAEGTIQKPGLDAKPYGGSPLDNHVPRDWRTVVDDDTFVRRFMEAMEDPFGGQVPETPQDCVDLLNEGAVNTIEYDDLIEMAEGVQVRGTLRHRENEHRMAKAEEWRQATTHDWEVITVEDSDTSMRVARD